MVQYLIYKHYENSNMLVVTEISHHNGHWTCIKTKVDLLI